MKSIKGVLLQASYPIYQAIDLPIEMTQNVYAYFKTKQSLIDENHELEKSILSLQKDVLTKHQLQIENNALKSLMNSNIRVSPNMMMGRVLSIKTTPFSHYAILNRGSKHQVFDGQPIFNANGVMGLVEHVGLFQSKIILISDPQMAVPVESTRTGERALAFGTGQLNKLEIKHVSMMTDLKIGDSLVTSGLGGRFLPGYPVGLITHESVDPSKKFKTFLVNNKTNISSSRYVFMVSPQSAVDQLAKDDNQEALEEGSNDQL